MSGKTGNKIMTVYKMDLRMNALSVVPSLTFAVSVLSIIAIAVRRKKEIYRGTGPNNKMKRAPS